VENLSLVLHFFAATLIVGPQVLLFVAVVPSTWLIEDEALKRAVTRVVTQRYGMIAGIAMATSLITGLYQFYNVTPEAVSEDMNSYRFGWIFITKMTLFTAFIAMVAVHAVIGRRIGRLADAVVAGDGDEFALENQRRFSLMLTMAMMAVSIGILVFGVLLGRGEFSHIEI
jgi:uncharacterized membrane protein